MFWTVVAILAVLTAAVLWLGYSQAAPARRVRAALGREIPIPTRAEDAAEMYFQPSPPRLAWNWSALALGPFWYFLQGLWVHGVILLSLILVSGGIFIPLVWLYSGLKGSEDLLEFRIARRNVY